MRHVFHEILARYLDTDQFAFETTPRELWPSDRFTLGLQANGNSWLARRKGGNGTVLREPESQN